jgi:hypothetical protein
MTVAELLETLPEEQREAIAEFLYGRTPCKLGLRDIVCEDILTPSRILSSSSQELLPIP